MSWQTFEQALLDYNKKEVENIVFHYLEEEDELKFIDEYVVQALTSIGEKWERGEVALSQVYMSSRLCEDIVLSQLKWKEAKRLNVPQIAILTLEDYHTLGKRIVSAVVRASGYTIYDYGTVSDANKIVERLLADNVKILLISVLMYPSALKIKDISKVIRKQIPTIKLLVGGAPFLMDVNLWKQVGADGWGRSAADDIAIIERWIEEGF
ncbi:MAG: trimethylamine corrinoid protein [Clostridiales bacterium]|nr:trimethylamine corrinoid protein [Clostridiales bacterium]